MVREHPVREIPLKLDRVAEVGLEGQNIAVRNGESFPYCYTFERSLRRSAIDP